jgi:hypothetical protein
MFQSIVTHWHLQPQNVKSVSNVIFQEMEINFKRHSLKKILQFELILISIQKRELHSLNARNMLETWLIKDWYSTNREIQIWFWPLWYLSSRELAIVLSWLTQLLRKITSSTDLCWNRCRNANRSLNWISISWMKGLCFILSIDDVIITTNNSVYACNHARL